MDYKFFGVSKEDLPKEVIRMLEELPGAIKDRMADFPSGRDFGSHMDIQYSVDDVLAMSEDEADKYFEDWINKGINDVLPGGLRVIIKVIERGYAQNLLRRGRDSLRGIVTHMPDNIREIVEHSFIPRIEEAGGSDVEIDWTDTFYVPDVWWKKNGVRYHSIFHYDGTFISSKSFKVDKPWEHNIDSIVGHVAERSKRK